MLNNKLEIKKQMPDYITLCTPSLFRSVELQTI